MPRVIGVSVAALVAVLSAVGARADEGVLDRFDPERLAAAELALVQTALAASGDYRDVPGGAWDAASAAALEAWAWREAGGPAVNGDAAALVLGVLEAATDAGWAIRALDGYGVSLALPPELMELPEAEEGGERWWSPDGALTLLAHRFDEAATRAWHEAAARADAGAGLRQRTPALLVTTGQLGDGRRFFTRSDRTAGGWATLYLAARPEAVASLSLAAASIRSGPPEPWLLPEEGRLAGLVEATSTLVGTPDAAPAALPSPDGAGGPVGSGTGFYLGPRTLVTAAHVVEACDRVMLPDGSPLRLVAADPELDVAVLAAAKPAPAWLSLAQDRDARLGQRVHAAGFPYYAIAGTSLNLTTGNVSALSGIDDDPRFFSFSAPVQPGNSGGPLIDAEGAVLGVVVARLSEDFIVEATGTLPQNVNYALAEGELAAFLDASGAGAAARGGLGRFVLDEGAPEGFEAAIVPVLCD